MVGLLFPGFYVALQHQHQGHPSCSSSNVPWKWQNWRRDFSPQGLFKSQSTDVLICGNLSCAAVGSRRARGSCASSTRTTWCTSETEPRRASRSASTSSGTGGGTAAPWTTRLCSAGSCRLVSFTFMMRNQRTCVVLYWPEVLDLASESNEKSGWCQVLISCR